MDVRAPRPAELPAVMTVLDSGGLEVGAEAVAAGVRAGRVLVAADGGRVLGALWWSPAGPDGAVEIEAVAVRPGRRGQGLGTALVAEAAARHDRLVAAFDPRVRPFWASLGFEIEAGEEPGRLRARLAGAVDRA